MLGPSYIDEIDESFLLPWETATVLSLEKNFSILLPTDAAAWSWSGPNRMPVWLGMAASITSPVL
jgi:hypothetical protein